MLLEACASESRDITWLRGLDGSLIRARAMRRPVVLKPLGQGLDDFDGW